MILVKTVRAKSDTTVVTRIEEKHMFVGQIANLKFLSEAEYEGHIAGGYIEPYNLPVPTLQRPPEIPIVKLTPKVVAVHTHPPVQTPTPVSIPAPVSIATGFVPPIVEVIKEEVVPEPIDIVVPTKEKHVEILNASGPPYKCSTKFCDRIRKKQELFCKVCLEKMVK